MTERDDASAIWNAADRLRREASRLEQEATALKKRAHELDDIASRVAEGKL